MKSIVKFFDLKIVILLFIASIFLVDCTPEPLEIDVPEFEQKMVVSSQFFSDSGAIVSLTRSFSALSDNYMPEKINIDFLNKVFVQHALVLLQHNGIYDTLTYFGPGVFGAYGLELKPGELYHLYAMDSTNQVEVSAQAVFLNETRFDTTFYKMKIENDDTSAMVHFQFTDLAGRNYYLMNVYTKNPEDSIELYNPNQSISDLPAWQEVNNYVDLEQYVDVGEINNVTGNLSTIQNYILKTILLKDSLFENSIYRDSLLFKNISIHDSIAISVSNISKEYYDYLTLRAKAETLYSQLMSEPINMPGNIVNGLGLFTTNREFIKFFYIE